MASTPHLQVERRADGVALIRIANGKVNSLSTTVLGELLEVVRSFEEDLPGAVVITGNGRMFAAGADIGEFGGPEQAAKVAKAFREALDAVAELPRATIAAVDGFALGGGCELALACDFRIAGDHARFGQPEVLLGIIPGGGGTQRLARLIGTARAKDLVLTGRQVRAEEALEIGLVDEIVPAADLMDRALARAAELARGAVVAQGLAKRAIDAGVDETLTGGLDLEGELFEEVFETEDSQIGVTSFREHGPGKAKFHGR